jgi:hypothetical protein
MKQCLSIPLLALVGCASAESPAPDAEFRHDLVLSMALRLRWSVSSPKQADPFDNCASLSIVGTGTSTCSEIVTCETACAGAKLDVDHCKEQCLVSGCTSAADEFQALSACVEQRCQAECAAQHCRECALAQCPAEAQACLSQTCPP